MLKRSSIHRHTFGEYVGRLASPDVIVERTRVALLTDDYLARMKAFGKVVLHGRVDGRRSGWSEQRRLMAGYAVPGSGELTDDKEYSYQRRRRCVAMSS
jgi:hypothetical protein